MRELVAAGVDLLALEMIPNYIEAKALVNLLNREYPQVPYFLSFSSQDGLNLSYGNPLEKVVSLTKYSTSLVAMGINCSSPSIVESFLKRLTPLTDRALVVYPNSGEVYDGRSHTWQKTVYEGSLLTQAKTYKKLGRQIIGGCCRTSPQDIASLVSYFHQRS